MKPDEIIDELNGLIARCKVIQNEIQRTLDQCPRSEKPLDVGDTLDL